MKNLLLLLLLFSCHGVAAQNLATQHLKKYWKYRQRFLGEDGKAGFIDLGLGQGQSLAASERNPAKDCLRDWHMVHQSCSLQEGLGGLVWADASLYHGYYIAVLAMEYKNLQEAGEEISFVAQELWWALEAFDRLDYNAEIALGLDGKLNGFFLRDDVPGDFFYEKESDLERRFSLDSVNAYQCIRSDFSCGLMDPAQGGFVSQDQILGLFMGFFTVSKMLGEEHYKKNLPSFGEKVAMSTNRIVNYLIMHNWKIIAPNGVKIPDKWGGNVLALSYPIAEAANRITGKYYRKDYHLAGSKGLGRLIYGALNNSFQSQHETNQVMALEAAILTNVWSETHFSKQAQKSDKIIFALMDAVLNEHTLGKHLNQADFEALIRTAPWDGPCFGTPNCQAPEGWRSYNRWLHARFKNGNPYGVKMESPGLDFMLLYNFYHFYYKKQLPKYQHEN